MPAEHRLTERPALYGKHPGHGDFISAGLPEGLGRSLSDWLGGILGEVRDLLGEGWDRVQASPVALRFWLGASICGGTPWRGAMRMSGDRVGRHYPLVVLQPTAPDSLPVVDTRQDFYEDAGFALDGLLAQPALVPADAISDLSSRLSPHTPGPAGPSDDMFWAIRNGTDIGQLCSEVALTDLVSAASTRSYWWFVNAHAGQSGILGGNGLPGAEALAWLLGGGGAAAVQDQTRAEDA